MLNKQVSNRVVNDIILALSSIDNYREAVETPENGVVFMPRILQFDAGTRLALARNVSIFREYEAALRRRHDELVLSMEPVEKEGRLQVPEERMPHFAKAWGLVLDEVREISFHDFDVGGLHGGDNSMPLPMLAYLYNLADPSSVEERFSGLSTEVEMSRNEALLLLAGLAGLDGKRVATGSPAGRTAVSIPWDFSARLREDLAYNFFVLHQEAADLNVRRTAFMADVDTSKPDPDKAAELMALLDEKVRLPLIKVRAEELNLETNGVPLAVIDQVQRILAD